LVILLTLHDRYLNLEGNKLTSLAGVVMPSQLQ
jgi:hypothetical protein